MMLKEIKRAARSTVRRLPDEGRVLTNAYKQLVVLRRVAATKLGTYGAASGIDPERVYRLDSARIFLATDDVSGRAEQPAFDPRATRGRVYGGPWDRAPQRFDDLPLAKAIRRRVSSAADWAETDYYATLHGRILAGAAAESGLKSQAELDEHCERLDRLIAAACEGGFASGRSGAASADHGYPLEIGVNIDRNGRYLLNDGAYALAVARALHLTQVPVKVRVRHRQWMEFCNFMRSLSEGGGAATRSQHLYQNPVHPDLQDIPAVHSCEDRFMAVRDVVPRRGGQLLDIGANLGYFCHRFEELGYTCHGIEYEPLIARAADKIRAAEGKTFDIVIGDLFAVADDERLRGKHWEVVLAFNIFHHFLKQKAKHDKLAAWLKGLNVDVMIFEPHRSAEAQMAGAYANYGEQEFVDFILSSSVLERSELVHRCADGRPIYKLWR